MEMTTPSYPDKDIMEDIKLAEAPE